MTGSPRWTVSPGEASHENLLPVALQLEQAQSGGIGAVTGGIGSLQAGDMLARDVGPYLVFEARDFAQDGSFLEFQQGLINRSLGLREEGLAVLGIGPVLGDFLLDLVAQIFESRSGVTSVVELLGGVEFGDNIAFLHPRAIGNQAGQALLAAGAVDSWHDDFGGANGFQGAG